MKKLTSYVVGLIAALAFSSSSSHATLIAYEGFNIATGSISGSSGTGGGSATWTTSPWNNTDGTWSANDAATLSYGSLVTTLGQGFSSGPGNQQTFREFGAQSATGTYWLGFLFNRSSGNTSDSMGISFFNGGTEHTFVAQPGIANYGFNAPFGNFSSTVPLVSGDTTFLLARYVMDGNTAVATSTAHYWINPNISSQPTDATAANGLSGTNFRAFAFDRFRLGSFGSQGVIDEIRLGTTFGDVAPIPEPSTYVMLALGLGALFFLRRRFVA